MPRALPDELLEEVLRRLPPQEPAELVRAALVSRRWCRVVSDPGFRRRFREFHRSPPMLGMLCNDYNDHIAPARFIPTTAFCPPRTDFRNMRVLDARHGWMRVLLRRGGVLLVWDPMTDEVRGKLPFPQKVFGFNPWTAAVLCSAASACAHLDCHHVPFVVVFVCSDHGNTFIYTYSSDAAAWSKPVIGQGCLITSSIGSVLVGNTLYFRYYDDPTSIGNTILKYNF